ncbi:MAG: hypothetical protein ACP5MB_11290 [bacterium]
MKKIAEKEMLMRSLAVNTVEILDYFKDIIIESVDDAIDVVKPEGVVAYSYFLQGMTEDVGYYIPDEALYNYVWGRVFEYLQQNFNKVAKDLQIAFDKDYSQLNPMDKLEILDYFIRINGIKTIVYDTLCKVIKGIMNSEIELKHDLLEGIENI